MPNGPPAGEPPLPPSPMTRVEELPSFGAIRLPWYTFVLTGLAGGVAGILAALLGPLHPDVGKVALFGGVGTAIRGAQVGLAATIADRVLGSWPRPLRWGLAMLVSGLVPGLEHSLGGLLYQTQVVPPGVEWWVLGGAVRDGCLGLALGLGAYRREGVLCRMALLGAGTLLAYYLVDEGLGRPGQARALHGQQAAFPVGVRRPLDWRGRTHRRHLRRSAAERVAATGRRRARRQRRNGGPMSRRLSICLVNWNTRDYLRACLQSIRDTAGGLDPQIIVVDNASSDGSAGMVRAEFPAVTLIANDGNLKYARGSNQALEAASGEFRLLLNPDTVLLPGALTELLAAAERHPRAGAAAPKLVHPDGSPQRSCRSFPDPAAIAYEALGLARLFPRSRRFGAYRMSWWDHDDERAVDQPMASALLLRAAALEEIGLFDEAFPMFFNDVDLCRRLWDAGWEVWFTPKARLIHHFGASTRQARRAMIAESHRSLLRYYEKHYRGRVPLLPYYGARALIRLGGALRGALAPLQRA